MYNNVQIIMGNANQPILQGGTKMGSKVKVQFNGTKEQEEQLKQVIADNKENKGALMPVLQKAQDIYGYLP